MSNTAKNLIVILGLITVAFGGYFMFMQQSATTLSFEANDNTLRNMQANSQLFIQRRQQLQAIELELSFFNDDRFLSLQSYDTPIVEQPVGRSNPFRTIVPLSIDQSQN
jgi:hypothetical protein